MERVVQGLAEAQAKLGHEIHVLTSDCSCKTMPAFETLNGVNIYRIKSRRLGFPDLTLPCEIPFKLIKQANLIHVHAHNSYFSQRILIESKKLNVKTACYFMAVDAFSDHPNWLVRSLAPYYGRRSVRKGLAATDLVLVKSYRDLNVLKERYQVIANYLPDAVKDSILLQKRESSEEFIRKFGIKQHNFFLFIGRMHKLKGPQILVKSLKHVNDDVGAVFIGPDDGYLKETLSLAEKLGVKDRTHVLGYVDEETKIQAIDASIAVVLPSVADYVEVYPGVMSEAWARGKAVIASDVGGNTYRIKHGHNGLLCERSNPQALGTALTKLVGDKKLAEAMGRHGKVAVHSWADIAEKSIEFYKKNVA